jgi:AcrR family transcriptional regulator
MVRHAIDASDKAARRQAILAAAGRLFVRAPDRLPSAATIAEEAGLAKGTVYLYFRTKEEIFMALLHEERARQLDQVQRAFAPGDARSPREKVDAFLDEYVSHIALHPEVLKLDALGYSIIERNVEQDFLLASKEAFLTAFGAAGAAVDAALALPPGQGVRMLLHSHALTGGLWQALDYPEHCRELIARSVLATSALDFAAELRAALGQYWRSLSL